MISIGWSHSPIFWSRSLSLAIISEALLPDILVGGIVKPGIPGNPILAAAAAAALGGIPGGNPINHIKHTHTYNNITYIPKYTKRSNEKYTKSSAPIYIHDVYCLILSRGAGGRSVNWTSRDSTVLLWSPYISNALFSEIRYSTTAQLHKIDNLQRILFN
mgnify:CR=1 FL=1